MTDCKHEFVRGETFIENSGKPAQKVFMFLRCKACGEIFPISPEHKVDNSAVLRDIEKALIYINQTLNKIADKLK